MLYQYQSSKMKLLIFLCFFAVATCREVKVARQGLVQELLMKSSTVEELVADTEKLIEHTIKEMNRSSTFGRQKLDESWNAIELDLENLYQTARNRTEEVVTYLLQDIDEIKAIGENAESCTTSLEPYVLSLNGSFDEQLQVIFSTWKYRANTSLENNYTKVLEKINLVEYLKTTLINCRLDEDCIVNVADEAVEYNLGLMDDLDSIYDNIETVHNETVTGAQNSAATTVYIDEEYVCNVARIIEECIQSRIDVPVITTTSPTTTTSTTPVTTEVTETEETTTEGTETTELPTSTPTPKVYCTHQKIF
ncbi:hypothetical protein JTB14_010132 [Gonioctena quinquepunctata]|nr:hypothetical protein JTB14_010132 [Gonioctena quinquepunctata]